MLHCIDTNRMVLSNAHKNVLILLHSFSYYNLDSNIVEFTFPTVRVPDRTLRQCRTIDKWLPLQAIHAFWCDTYSYMQINNISIWPNCVLFLRTKDLKLLFRKFGQTDTLELHHTYHTFKFWSISM